MSISRKGINTFFFYTLTLGIFIAFGMLHHEYFYPLIFHGDSSATQVLAKAMLDEKSLLPYDFTNYNQINLFRPSPFIAAALALGYQGYDAFMAGTTANLVFWALIIYFAISIMVGDRNRALLYSCILLIPTGLWEADYILGQQSHLSNFALAMCTVAFSYLFLSSKKSCFNKITLTCFLLITLESPARGFMILLPLSIAILLYFDKRKSFRHITILTIISLLGYFLNKFLISYHEVYINHFQSLTFHNVREILKFLIAITEETLSSITPINSIANLKLSLTGLLVQSSGLCFAIAMLFFFKGKLNHVIVAIKNLTKHEKNDQKVTYNTFISTVAVLGLISGALEIASLIADTARHFLWAYMLLKLSFILTVHLFLSKVFTIQKLASFFLVAGFFMTSYWTAEFVREGTSISSKAKDKMSPKVTTIIREISELQGIKFIYGEDYWRMMPLNTQIPSVSAGVLTLNNVGEIIPYPVHARKSWFNHRDKVLYYLKDGAVDSAIKQKLFKNGGILLHSSPEGTIWEGPPVWSL